MSAIWFVFASRGVAAALPWGAHFGVQVMAGNPDVAGPTGRVLEPGERLSVAGTTISKRA